MNTEDQRYLTQCLELALQGTGSVAPNPLVGSVIVRDGNVIGSGFHTKVGCPHAEVEAVNSVKDKSLLKGATIYVNLEPCCHHGRTPPCTDLILKSGFSRVVFSCKDIFPAVAGKGAALLEAAGIQVDIGCLHNEALFLNRRFYTFHQHKRPYIILKWAQTADGFIARDDYSSKWISNDSSRRRVHRWRAEEQAILVGYRTAYYDNPQLTVRDYRDYQGKNPLRIVCDREGSLPPTHHLLSDNLPTLIVGNQTLSNPLKEQLSVASDGDLLSELLSSLYQRQILSLIVEGGAATINQCIQRGLWDEARVIRSTTQFGSGISAPQAPAQPYSEEMIEKDTLSIYYSDRIRTLLKP